MGFCLESCLDTKKAAEKTFLLPIWELVVKSSVETKNCDLRFRRKMGDRGHRKVDRKVEHGFHIGGFEMSMKCMGRTSEATPERMEETTETLSAGRTNGKSLPGNDVRRVVRCTGQEAKAVNKSQHKVLSRRGGKRVVRRSKMSAVMEMMERETREVRQMDSATMLLEQHRAEALTRLVLLLEEGAEVEQSFTPHVAVGEDALHRLSSLRQAHASYALNTMGDMRRVGPGAWLRRSRV